MPGERGIPSSGRGRTPLKGFPPSTQVSLHTTFFMPWLGLTQGPPDSLQPGDSGDRFFESQLIREGGGVAKGILPFGSHVYQCPRFPGWRSRIDRRADSASTYTNRLSTSFGVVREASKFWKPPMPTRFIHSKSSLIPSLGDVAIHPVPPDARLGGVGRILKSFFERGRCILG